MYSNVQSKKQQAKSRYSDVNDEPLTRLLSPIKGYDMVPLVSLEQAISPVSKLFDGIDEYVYVAKENCQKPADGLTPDESASIQLYTMQFGMGPSLYMVLNTALRSEDRDVLKPWFSFLKLFITSLYKLPSQKQTLWRGLRDVDLSAKYPKGKRFVWWGVSSCTLNVDVLNSDVFLGKEGTRTLFSIECTNGKPIGSHSYFQNKEQEVILMPGSYLEVVGQLKPTVGLSIIQLRQLEPPIQFLRAPFTNSTSISNTFPRANLSLPTPSKPVDSQKVVPSLKLDSEEAKVEKHTTKEHKSSFSSNTDKKSKHSKSSIDKNHLSVDKYNKESSIKFEKTKGYEKQNPNQTITNKNGMPPKTEYLNGHGNKNLPQRTNTPRVEQNQLFRSAAGATGTASAAAGIGGAAAPAMPQRSLSDHLFVDGLWWNRFIQGGVSHGPFQHFMTFNPYNNTFQGYGTDSVGDFIINGSYDKNTLQMTLIQAYQAGTGNPYMNGGHQCDCAVTWNHATGCFEGPMAALSGPMTVYDTIFEMWPAHIVRN